MPLGSTVWTRRQTDLETTEARAGYKLKSKMFAIALRLIVCMQKCCAGRVIVLKDWNVWNDPIHSDSFYPERFSR